jgi:NAD(P)H dehydrogenase (quinone)
MRYDITGPERHTTAEIAALAAEVTGTSIQVIQVSDAELAQGMRAAGVPDAWVPVFVSFDANTREGKIDVLSDAVKTLTGKAPQKLRDFLQANRSQLQSH